MERRHNKTKRKKRWLARLDASDVKDRRREKENRLGGVSEKPVELVRVKTMMEKPKAERVRKGGSECYLRD